MTEGACASRGAFASSAPATCIEWQAARAARARAVAAWASDVLALGKFGVAPDRVVFAGFGAESFAGMIDLED